MSPCPLRTLSSLSLISSYVPLFLMPLSRDENAQRMRNLRKQSSTSTQALQRRSAQDAKRKRDKRRPGTADSGSGPSHVSSLSTILDHQVGVQPGSTPSGSSASYFTLYHIANSIQSSNTAVSPSEVERAYSVLRDNVFMSYPCFENVPCTHDLEFIASHGICASVSPES
jgi:hypothetical protein